ncbi:hypothetical protein GURASL_04860 [Geotalea uraniireducens]|uniref:Uncharacterized protein n=1 Tax=Geotalea uraniireducens TaxID=351604 RepID=A0ABM8EGK3_9BACT|nr:hypothetical protein GURASL_04860 [Geotalea uraniireducens]
MTDDVIGRVADLDLFLEGGAARQEELPEHGLRRVPPCEDELLLDGMGDRLKLAKYRLAGASGYVGGPGVPGTVTKMC